MNKLLYFCANYAICIAYEYIVYTLNFNYYILLYISNQF